MSEMIERVALAIEKAMFAPHEAPLPKHLHDKYLATACIVIAAMREPTSEMLKAGFNAEDKTLAGEWHAMIAAALAEKEPK